MSTAFHTHRPWCPSSTTHTNKLPFGTRLLVLDSTPLKRIYNDNEAILTLERRLPQKPLMALAINTPFCASAPVAFLESLENVASELLEVVPDPYQLETFYHDFINQLHLQMTVLGEEHHTNPPLFWSWVGNHTLMLAHHYDPRQQKRLRQLSNLKVENYLTAHR